jgi:hypothetical protein
MAVDFELRFQLDDACGDFDQAPSQGVKLHDRPDPRARASSGASTTAALRGAGVQEEAELIGFGPVPLGSVGDGVVLPCFDVIIGLAAGAVELRVKRRLARPALRLMTMKRVSVSAGEVK